MFIKNLILPNLSREGRVKYINLHPTLPYIVICAYQSDYEIFIYEFEYLPPADPAESEDVTSNRESIEKDEEFRDEGAMEEETLPEKPD
jgi:hypothetical protein